MKTTLLTFGTMLSALVFAAASRAADDHDHEHKLEPISEAVAVIAPTKASKSEVAGVIVLKQEKGYVQVTGEVSGLTPGEHGFHIHMFGDLRSADGMSLGGHYNPHGHPHGGPESKERHEGDLGNIKADAKGVAKVNVKADHVDLRHVLGRSLVVHGDVDDLKSQPAGNAGPRIGVGVIGMAEVKAPAKPK
jgi:Cu-Zn family superoxide dismutase